MSVEIKEINSVSDIKKFAKFPYEIYKNNTYWATPLFSQEKNTLIFQKKYYSPQIKFFLAFQNNKIVGRIAANINDVYNKKTNTKYLRISKIEFIDNLEVSNALFDEVCNYAKLQKMDYVHGPLGMSNLDTQGLLIDGFDYIQSLGSNYHLPYYRAHFEKYGFVKEVDWLDFKLNLNKEVIEKGNRASELIKKRYNFKIPQFTKNSEILQYKKEIFETINEAFEHLPFVIPFDKYLEKYYTNKYLKLLNPKYFKIALKDNKFAGFIVANPSLSITMQKIGGRLNIFNFHYLKNNEKNNDTADFLLAATRKQFSNQGLAVVLFAEIQKTLFENGYKYCEITGNIETNLDVINNWKSFEYIQHKRRRCYVKKIN